ncbi:MAG TPA: type IV pilus assembly protein PilM [Candidatus Saccharimonadaceae bacterium]|nr:type IV pilus assembly protein PilM [Candidatus Saccharimonadaceae bacterium]
MALLKGVGDFFALDIGTTAVRVVQLQKAGAGVWNLVHYGYTPVDQKLTSANSQEAEHRLSEVIMTAVGQSGIKTKNVAIGLPSQKTFATVIDVPTMSVNELRSTIKYQIDQYIPMSIDEAKVDWALLGQSAHDPKKQEVLLASTANEYAESRLELVENLGLNVIAAEPDPIAMARALLPNGVTDARLIIDVGELSTNLVITYADAPRLVRTIPTGINSLVKAAVSNLNVQEDQARQFILKFGLAPDRLEGQVFHAVEATLDNFASELTKSIKFFQTRYPNVPVGGILLSGYGMVVPKFAEYVTSKTGVTSQPANPWQKVRMSQSDQQQLATIATEFAAAVGLAERENRS